MNYMLEYRNEQIVDMLIDIKGDFLSSQGVDLGEFCIGFGIEGEENCRAIWTEKEKRETLKDFPKIKDYRIYSSLGGYSAFSEDLYFSDKRFVLLDERVDSFSIIHELAHVGVDNVWKDENMFREIGYKRTNALHEGIAMKCSTLDIFDRYNEPRQVQEFKEFSKGLFDKNVNGNDILRCEERWVSGALLDWGNEDSVYIIGGRFVDRVWRKKDNLVSIVNRFKENVPTDEEILNPELYIEKTRNV